MRFKEFREAVIVPPKLNIKTNDIKKLNRQFKDTIISFNGYVKTPGEMNAAYIPEIDEIHIEITKDASYNTIEALLQHEIIHSIQDSKSGMRMAASIEKERQQQIEVTNQIKKAKESDLPGLLKKLEQLEVKRAFLNHEEEMTYAYMAVKLRDSENPSEVIKKFQGWWNQETQTKLSKRFMKYFNSYWTVKDEL